MIEIFTVMELAVRPWLLRSPPSPSNVRRGNEQCAKVLTKLGLPMVEAKLCCHISHGMIYGMTVDIYDLLNLLINHVCRVSKNAYLII